jgi:hypothetical protein
MRNTEDQEDQYEYYESLDTHIYVANLIPFGDEIVTAEKAVEDYPALAEHLSDVAPDKDSVNYRVQRDYAVLTHKLLKALVDISEKIRANKGSFEVKYFENRSEFLHYFECFMPFIQFSVNRSHGLEVIWRQDFERFIRDLPNYDVRRFRSCLVCRKIFWANRLNAKYCSRLCSNKHHQKLYQSDPLKHAEFNKKRRENYAFKQNKKRRKENGTL